ncbi:MAG: HlyD family efflux transporter periplasmic adaptor subunit [Bacteroidetes bacterium]|nr:HlyD family efflux transporter periplasmic adaptor subunit [Bacteroidota bacterium]
MKQNSKLYKSSEAIYLINEKSKVHYFFCGAMFFLIVLMFLPWTQNIKSAGNITTLKQENRPQKVNSPIPGKISKWLVKEGDFVKKDDSILILTEIKEDYLDPQLIARTKSQLDAKNESILFYQGKINTTNMQIGNLNKSKRLKIVQLSNKLKQLNNKLTSEKAELVANENEVKLLKNQYERQLKMYEEGLVSQTQFQQRNIQFQNATAKKINTENKISQTQQDLINIQIEQNGIEQEYAEKVNKAEGDKFQNLSYIATTQGELAKLQNQVSNYTIRNGMYLITASQDGQIVQANKSGIGEILKEGETILIIVPTRVDYAVEIFVKPMDLPLVNKDQAVRFTFDGFPAIVFSGWPEGSYGTFAGKVVSIESTISDNGYYRVLVAEDSSRIKWPQQLRIGTGAQGILLINDVPIWYELWRNINGFPADFYANKKNKTK